MLDTLELGVGDEDDVIGRVTWIREIPFAIGESRVLLASHY
jgi:hypothetical protein